MEQRVFDRELFLKDMADTDCLRHTIENTDKDWSLECDGRIATLDDCIEGCYNIKVGDKIYVVFKEWCRVVKVN